MKEKFINSERFIQLLTEHFYLKEKTYFNIAIEMKIKETEHGETPDMTIYLERTILGDKVRTPLTEDEVKKVLASYAETPKESLSSYLYVGGIHHTGYFVEEDEAYFTGVMIYTKEKELKDEKCLQKK